MGQNNTKLSTISIYDKCYYLDTKPIYDINKCFKYFLNVWGFGMEDTWLYEDRDQNLKKLSLWFSVYMIALMFFILRL